MCGRYTLSHQQMVENAFAAALDMLPADIRRPRVNIAHGQMVLVLRQVEGPGRVAESLLSSRLWRRLLEHEGGRCLVPVDGFCEWQSATGRPKQLFPFEHAAPARRTNWWPTSTTACR